MNYLLNKYIASSVVNTDLILKGSADNTVGLQNILSLLDLLDKRVSDRLVTQTYEALPENVRRILKETFTIPINITRNYTMPVIQ